MRAQFFSCRPACRLFLWTPDRRYVSRSNPGPLHRVGNYRALGFHEIVERSCGDAGEVPVSKVLEGYSRCEKKYPDLPLDVMLALADGRYIIVTRESHFTNDELLTACTTVLLQSDPIWLSTFQDT